jgi:stearoyl-CoA desaturase (delta-9 desaturase)
MVFGIISSQHFAFQNHIYEWSRDHRVHHKFSETDADPHNAKRGFFFSHVGWLLLKKHPDVRNKGKAVDMSDLEKDFVVVFQRR